MDKRQYFRTTQWSLIREATGDDSGVAKNALHQLCEQYWFPLYSFVRFKGLGANEAEDATQAFFTELIRREDLDKLDPNVGRFRSFLRTAISNFLKNEWAKNRAKKRGGDVQHFAIDYQSASRQFDAQPVFDETPEDNFERQWALTLLQTVQSKLEREFERRGRSHVFQRLIPFLVGAENGLGIGDLAAELDMSEVAVRVAIHRMRVRFGEILRSEILETVGSKSEVDEEITHLFSVLTGK